MSVSVGRSVGRSVSQSVSQKTGAGLCWCQDCCKKIFENTKHFGLWPSSGVGWSVSQSVSPSFGQSVSQSLTHSVRRSVSHSLTQSVRRSVSQSVSHSVTQSVRWSVTQSVSQTELQKMLSCSPPEEGTLAGMLCVMCSCLSIFCSSVH